MTEQAAFDFAYLALGKIYTLLAHLSPGDTVDDKELKYLNLIINDSRLHFGSENKKRLIAVAKALGLNGFSGIMKDSGQVQVKPPTPTPTLPDVNLPTS